MPIYSTVPMLLYSFIWNITLALQIENQHSNRITFTVSHIYFNVLFLVSKFAIIVATCNLTIHYQDFVALEIFLSMVHKISQIYNGLANLHYILVQVYVSLLEYAQVKFNSFVANTQS